MNKAVAVLDTSSSRKADLAAIHIGKAALGWSDEEYRDILWAVCQVRSSAALDFSGRKRFLAHLRGCGWEHVRDHQPGRSRAPWTAMQNRIWSLWQQLADAGHVKLRDRKALDSWLLSHTGVQRLEWLNERQQVLAIESLKLWLGRPVRRPE